MVLPRASSALTSSGRFASKFSGASDDAAAAAEDVGDAVPSGSEASMASPYQGHEKSA